MEMEMEMATLMGSVTVKDSGMRKATARGSVTPMVRVKGSVIRKGTATDSEKGRGTDISSWECMVCSQSWSF
jgi:hypothetical protein